MDLLPTQTRLWHAVESLARDHFRRAGVEESAPRRPELFSRGIGEGTDVVGKEMYSLLDRGQRRNYGQRAPHQLCVRLSSTGC